MTSPFAGEVLWNPTMAVTILQMLLRSNLQSVIEQAEVELREAFHLLANSWTSLTTMSNRPQTHCAYKQTILELWLVNIKKTFIEKNPPAHKTKENNGCQNCSFFFAPILNSFDSAAIMWPYGGFLTLYSLHISIKTEITSFSFISSSIMWGINLKRLMYL